MTWGDKKLTNEEIKIALERTSLRLNVIKAALLDASNEHLAFQVDKAFDDVCNIHQSLFPIDFSKMFPTKNLEENKND